MANVELVVKIPKEMYEQIKDSSTIFRDDERTCYEAVKNGTLLPKGHKRLIEDNFDVGSVFDEEGNLSGYRYVTQEDLNNALTIIEADMGD